MQVNMIPLKLVETLPLGYFASTAALFWLRPDTLSNPAYALWERLTAHEWAAMIAAICVAHAAALWWNGRNAVASRMARTVALAGYLYVSMAFGVMFVASGLLWGAILFFGLLPTLCGALLVRVVAETKILRRLT